MPSTVKHPQSTWRWFGSPGHFICGKQCRFHLCTLVGGYLISTVGELWFERPSREIHAKIHDPQWLVKNQHRKGDDFDAVYMERFGFEEIGLGRKYETMVFKAGEPCRAEGCNCGLPAIDSTELNFSIYNDAGAANIGHLAMCLTWANGVPVTEELNG